MVEGSDLGPLALGHNGNLVNAPRLRRELQAAGITPRTTTDSELIALACAYAEGSDWLSRVRRTPLVRSASSELVTVEPIHSPE